MEPAAAPSIQPTSVSRFDVSAGTAVTSVPLFFVASGIVATACQVVVTLSPSCRRDGYHAVRADAGMAAAVAGRSVPI